MKKSWTISRRKRRRGIPLGVIPEAQKVIQDPRHLINRVLFSGFIALGLAACGAEPTESSIEPAQHMGFEPWQLSGPDRMERLIAGAQAEGELSFYTSLPVLPTTEITEAFEAKYSIPVIMYRAESTQLLQRAVNEARAGRHVVDVVETAAAEVEAMEREQLLQAVDFPVFEHMAEGAALPGRAWIASRLTLFVVAYNTGLVGADEVPQTFQDLLDPKWNGMIGIEAENANWLMEVSAAQGRNETITLFNEIAKTNGMSARRGHTLLVNLVASGEIPIGINAYHEHVDQARERGAPVDYVFMPPVIAMPLVVATLRDAPHPYAAILFMDFLLNEGQQLIANQMMIPTNTNYPSKAGEPDFKILDVSKYVDENQEWLELYRELFLGQ
jgi:iron(III) transport system substrate-binding protein